MRFVLHTLMDGVLQSVAQERLSRWMSPSSVNGSIIGGDLEMHSKNECVVLTCTHGLF